jgi:proteasome lid subunit RPN8/RPN11
MRVRRSVLDAIADHARRTQPEECCGLLVSSDDEIVEAVATSNLALDRERRYEVSPAEHFALIRRCRAEDLAIVGVYHSHPRSAPLPSPTDRELAFSEFLFVIAGPVTGDDPVDVRAYRLNDGAFEEVRLEAVAEPAG